MGVRDTDTPCSKKSVYNFFGPPCPWFHIQGFSCRLCGTAIRIFWRKSLCKWTPAIQTHVIQGSIFYHIEKVFYVLKYFIIDVYCILSEFFWTSVRRIVILFLWFINILINFQHSINFVSREWISLAMVYYFLNVLLDCLLVFCWEFCIGIHE